MVKPTGQRKRKAAEDVAHRETSRIDAAILVASRNLHEHPEGRAIPLTNEEIAERAGVSRTTLYRWMHRDPEFAALVGDAEGQIKAAALRVPSANVHHRIKNLDMVAEGIVRVIRERAERHSKMIDVHADISDAERAMREILGSIPPAEAATGLLVQQPKVSANGTVVTEWAVDTGTLKELRETYKHIAQQLKQWEESVNVNHGGSIDHTYHNERLDQISDDERLAKIEALLSGEDA